MKQKTKKIKDNGESFLSKAEENYNKFIENMFLGDELQFNNEQHRISCFIIVLSLLAIIIIIISGFFEDTLRNYFYLLSITSLLSALFLPFIKDEDKNPPYFNDDIINNEIKKFIDVKDYLDYDDDYIDALFSYIEYSMNKDEDTNYKGLDVIIGFVSSFGTFIASLILSIIQSSYSADFSYINIVFNVTLFFIAIPLFTFAIKFGLPKKEVWQKKQVMNIYKNYILYKNS